MALLVTPGHLSRRAEFYYQLGSTMSAGIALIKALQMVTANPAVRGSRREMLQLIECLQSGLTFTQSMEQVGNWMPEFDTALLATGEKTGRLDSAFKILSVYYATRAQIIRDTIAGLIVTVATLHVFIMVFPVGFLTRFAQGIATGDYRLCLPFIIQKIATFGLLYGVVFFLLFACQAKRSERWRALVESIMRCIPILRHAQKYLVLSRLAASLHALVTAGVSILIGWDLASATTGSPLLRKKILAWKPRLESGSTPSELVNETRYFPEMFANLYHTGEESGQLDDTLGRLHTFYQEEGFRMLRIFTRVMNGFIYGTMALGVAFMVIRFWLGYYGAMMNSF